MHCRNPVVGGAPNRYVCDACKASRRPQQLAAAQKTRRAKVKDLLAQVPPPGSVVLTEQEATALREGLDDLASAVDRHVAAHAAIRMNSDEWTPEADNEVAESTQDLADLADDVVARWRKALPPDVLP